MVKNTHAQVREGAFDIASDYEQVCGRKHRSLEGMMVQIRDISHYVPIILLIYIVYDQILNY